MRIGGLLQFTSKPLHCDHWRQWKNGDAKVRRRMYYRAVNPTRRRPLKLRELEQMMRDIWNSV